jgi:hypothetical protein
MLLEGNLNIIHLQWLLEYARGSKGYYSDSHFQHFVNSFSQVFLLTSQVNCGSDSPKAYHRMLEKSSELFSCYLE